MAKEIKTFEDVSDKQIKQAEANAKRKIDFEMKATEGISEYRERVERETLANMSKLFHGYLDKNLITFKSNIEQQNKIFEALIDKRFQNEYSKASERSRRMQKLESQLSKLKDDLLSAATVENKKSIEDAIKQKDSEYQNLIKQEKTYQETVYNLRKEAEVREQSYQRAAYKRMSVEERRKYNEDVYQQLRIKESALQEEIKLKKQEQDHAVELQEAAQTKLDKLAKNASKEQREKAKNDLEFAKNLVKQKSEEVQKSEEELNIVRQQKDKSEKQSHAGITRGNREERIKAADARLKHANENLDDKQSDLAVANFNLQTAREKARSEREAKLEELRKRRDHAQMMFEKATSEKQKRIWSKALENRNAEEDKLLDELLHIEELDELSKETKEAEKARKEAEKAEAEAEAAESAKKKLEKKNKAVDTALQIGSAVSSGISSNLTALYGKQGSLQARLQGSGEDWKNLTAKVSDTIFLSGVVSQKNVVAKMTELVDSGIAYNLELRAFLAETSANIASTFDAANGTLLRLIRLQQQDTTAARLGMEASLTKLFNEYFQDTSYLTKGGAADSVSTAIIDAAATMSRDEAVEFEFNVQKWLGSLYSLGLSSDAVSTIAQGLNYLGTGNVTALSGNTALQTLFAMSASRLSGTSYAQILTEGLNSNTTNLLLRSMIDYLAEIAESQENNVTTAAYAELFGMSVTDLRTFASLTKQEVDSLTKRSESYDSLTKEVNNQLNQISNRLSISQMIDTVIENAEVGAAQNIGSLGATYGMWRATEVVKNYVGKVPIPGILAAGFGISSETDLLNLIQTGMAGLGLVSTLLEGIGSLDDIGALDLDNWGGSDVTSRGGTLKTSGSLSSKVSYSAKIGTGNLSSQDIEQVSLDNSKQKALDSAGTTSEEMEEQKEIPEKIYDALKTDGSSVVNLLIKSNEFLKDLSDPKRVFYTALTGALTNTGISQYTNLYNQLDGRTDIVQDLGSMMSSIKTGSTYWGGSSTVSNNTTEELKTLLDPNRVFYTAITGVLTSDAANKVMNLSSEIANTTSIVQQETNNSSTSKTSSSKSTSYTKGFSSADSTIDSEDVVDLAATVANAVARGLSDYAMSNKLPVSVSTYGG